jgi:microcystin degradation protein MlrC
MRVCNIYVRVSNFANRVWFAFGVVRVKGGSTGTIRRATCTPVYVRVDTRDAQWSATDIMSTCGLVGS